MYRLRHVYKKKCLDQFSVLILYKYILKLQAMGLRKVDPLRPLKTLI